MSQTIDHLLEQLRAELPHLAREYGVRTLGVFGSYIRQEQREDSDLDVLVGFDAPPSLLRFIELEHRLTETLGVPVDLVMEEALKPRIGEQIRREVVTL